MQCDKSVAAGKERWGSYTMEEDDLVSRDGSDLGAYPPGDEPVHEIDNGD